MKRTKAPVLTSPGKIGFFVSLMLVFVSIGVAYLSARRFGVAWDLLGRGWSDPKEWLGIIRGEGFLFELLPLAGLVSVSAMISYLVINSAVRKYKRYLDSGCDYRNLVSSLKDIESLEDKRKIERIKNHPELKRLLLGVVETFEERERLLSEREGALDTRLQDALQAQQTELVDGLAKECDRLVTAIESGAVEPSAIEFSTPALKKLGAVIGRVVHPAPQPHEPARSESHGDLLKTTELVHSKLREIAGELRTSCEGAQEIETRLRATAGSTEGDSERTRLDAARKEIKTVVAALKSLEQINAAIDALSEESKGVAINTALHAGSGTGTQDDLIRLAEEVKEVAARFKDAARRFAQTATAMRSSAGILDSIAGDSVGRTVRSASPEEDLAGVLSRVSLWVERVLVLSDKVSNLCQSYDISVSPLLNAGAGRDAETPAVEGPVDAEPRETEEFGFESLDRSRSLFGRTQTLSEEEPAVGKASERRFFEDESSEPLPSFGATDAGEMSRMEPGEERDEEPAGAAFEPETHRFDSRILNRFSGTPAPMPADEAILPLEADRTPEEDRRTFEPEGEKPTGAEETTEPSGERKPETTREKAGVPEPDEDAVDLYALGAVDYDAALHG